MSTHSKVITRTDTHTHTHMTKLPHTREAVFIRIEASGVKTIFDVVLSKNYWTNILFVLHVREYWEILAS